MTADVEYLLDLAAPAPRTLTFEIRLGRIWVPVVSVVHQPDGSVFATLTDGYTLRASKEFWRLKA